MDITELESPRGVVVSVGGQTPNNLALGDLGISKKSRGKALFRSWVFLEARLTDVLARNNISSNCFHRVKHFTRFLYDLHGFFFSLFFSSSGTGGRTPPLRRSDLGDFGGGHRRLRGSKQVLSALRHAADRSARVVGVRHLGGLCGVLMLFVFGFWVWKVECHSFFLKVLRSI